MTDMVDSNFASQFDRLPPSSIEAEMCYLASAMLDKQVFEDTRDMLSPDQFYQADHGIIYQVLCEMYRAGKAVDAVLLSEELKRRGLLDEIGGTSYLGQILNSVPSPAHGEHYAKIVCEKARLRELISLSNEIIRECYRPHDADPSDAIISRIDSQLQSIRDRGQRDTIRTLESFAHEVFDRMERQQIDRVSTGIQSLDELVGGLPVGGTTLISGRPGSGKSQLAKQIARNRASNCGDRVGIITIEETGRKIATNYLASVSGISNHALMYRRLRPEDWTRLPEAVGLVSAIPIVIDDAQQKLGSIEATAMRMVRKYGCGTIIVDHIHLIDAEMPGKPNRTAEITKISSGLKFLFKRLNVAGILVCQENRQNSSGDQKPDLRDLRDSGTLEQDGDLILQLYRPDYFNWKKNDNFIPDHKLHVYVSKNKDGPVGEVTLKFDGDSQTISDWPVADPFQDEPF